MPLWYSIAAVGLIGLGVGTVFPIATVSVQNAVERHEMGVATGAMNFFRALAGALVVAIMGAILLAGLGMTPERGGAGLDLAAASFGASGVEVAEVFRWMFAAGLVFSVIAMIAIFFLEERALTGPTAQSPRPAPAE